MGKSTLVERDTRQGRELIQTLAESKFPIDGAVWHLDPESRDYQLVIVTRLVQDPGPLTAYKLVQAALDRFKPSERVPLERIHLVSPKNEVADVLKELRATANAANDPSDDRGLDGVFVDDDYVYLIQVEYRKAS